MATYVYETATGRLESWAPEDLQHNDPAHQDALKAGLAPLQHLEDRGLTAVADLRALDETHVWDEASHSVLEIVAPVKPVIALTGAWILRLADDEYDEITACTDVKVRKFRDALNRTTQVDLASTHFEQGVAYLTTVKRRDGTTPLLAPERVAALLAP